MRSFISPAALLVKVMATTSSGRALRGGEQVGDAVGEHARLARAGAGQDEQRTVGVGDGLALRLVEAGEQVLGRWRSERSPPSMTKAERERDAAGHHERMPASTSRSRDT